MTPGLAIRSRVMVSFIASILKLSVERARKAGGLILINKGAKLLYCKETI